MQWLGMTKPPGVKRNFLHQILKTVEDQGEHHLRSAKEDQVIAACTSLVCCRAAQLSARRGWAPATVADRLIDSWPCCAQPTLGQGCSRVTPARSRSRYSMQASLVSARYAVHR